MTPDPYALLPADTVTRGRSKINIDSIVQTLSLRDKIGQLVMPWLAGSYSANDGEGLDSAYVAVDSFHVGGIIVSVGTPLDVAAKLNALQLRSKLPLIVASDLESGTGTRLLGGTSFPMAMAIGATGRPLDAYEMGRITAIEARAVGIQWTFSPDADVNNNPENPIINTRSFGEDPHEVATLVSAFVRGAREHGLFTTAKHFPGHGDVQTDSHIAVPVTPACWPRLDTLELVPFRAAIAAGVTGVMTAHIALPCIEGPDPFPATLSRQIMTGLLRDSLNFHGIVVTDALTMGAIVSKFGAGESAVRAFLAGSDLLLMPTDIPDAVDAMVAAVDSGRIPMARLDASVHRVLALKVAAGLFRHRTVPLDSVPVVVGQAAFQHIADDIAQRAVTLVRRGPIDTLRAARGRLAVVLYAEETNLSIGNELIKDLRAAGDTVSAFRLYPASGPLSYDSARAVLARAPRALFASSVRPIAWRGNIALPDSLAAMIDSTAAHRSTMLVSFGSPYLLDQLPDYGGGYLLAWSDDLAAERAVARALAGLAPITGHLPIGLSDGIERGTGIQVEGP